jgi:hypothetical protein
MFIAMLRIDLLSIIVEMASVIKPGYEDGAHYGLQRPCLHNSKSLSLTSMMRLNAVGEFLIGDKNSVKVATSNL